MKELAFSQHVSRNNVIGLHQLGRRLKNLVYLSSEQLYEWAILARSDHLRSILVRHHVERSQLALAIDEYLIDYQCAPAAANDDCHSLLNNRFGVPERVQFGDNEVIDLLALQEEKFSSDIKRLAMLLPEFPGDLLLNIGFSCCELKAELMRSKALLKVCEIER